MSLLNKKAIRQFFHDKGKRITTAAMVALEVKVENILWSSLRLSRKFRTIKETEINLSNGK